MSKLRHVLVPLLLLSLASCVGGKKSSSSKQDQEALQSSILPAAPENMVKLEISFDRKVSLIGYTVTPELAAPGTEVKITYYWELKEPIGDGWMLFTHVVDDSSKQMLNLDWTGPLRTEKDGTQILGPSKWEVGKVYADSQSFTVPDWGDSMGAELQVKVGIWNNSGRLPVVRGAHDAEQAGIVATLKTGKVAKAPAAPVINVNVPDVSVPHLAAGESIVIDGKADEAAWSLAGNTGAFVDVSTGAPNTTSPVNGSAKLLWDDASMYLFFTVQDPDVIGGYKDAKSQPNKFTSVGSPKLWENDTIEIMTDPEGDGDNVDYYELQINPQNKVFHSQFDAYNAPRGEPNGPFGHEDWDPKLKSAVQIQGTMDKSDDKDQGYTPDAPWRMNFYAMKNNGGVSWSPILGQGNFHKATRFGRVRFIGGKVTKTETPVVDAGPAAAIDAGMGPSQLLKLKRLNKGTVKLPN
jgi:Carbohydrate family 9 binding domain-like